MSYRQTLFACIVVVSLLAAAPPATAATSPSFTVDLQENGDADVSVTYTFDLDTDSEQAAFEELRDNQSARDAIASRFEGRLDVVASNAADRTGRRMSVTDPTVDISTDGATGVVTLQATWQGLAAVEDDQLLLTEPFASEFDPDRRFVVTLPDGYTADETPEADSQSSGELAWDSGTSLDGFELVATDESAGSDDGSDVSDASGPGLGLVAGVLALVAVGLLGRRRT